ncbi:MAG: hypothetical protein LIP01_06605, partial [Tannerellaceae bacterium]|nr:hypothetical protein [Tannerellaceae bacterium]
MHRIDQIVKTIVSYEKSMDSILFLVGGLSNPLWIHAQKLVESVPAEKYRWQNVRITGGGFVDGIVFHPTVPHVRYCRTDMGGAYRWDEAGSCWIPLLDWLPAAEANLMGIESLALDPQDPETVYLVCGTSTRGPDGAILYSRDAGQTFRRVDMSFGMGGNENGRGNGERMMVDPVNSHIIYLGTRDAGLWRSHTQGIDWEQVSGFPDITEQFPDSLSFRDRFRLSGSGIVFVLFDSSTGIPEKGCSTIYAGVSLMDRENLFVSRDSGVTWEPVSGHPTAYRPLQATLTKDGYFYIVYGTNPGPLPMENGAVWKYNTRTGEWKDISPVCPAPEQGEAFGYASVAVDPGNSKHVLVSTFGRPVPGKHTEDDIFRSTDGGVTWQSVFSGKVEMDYSKTPYTEFTPLHWMFDIEIDPFNPDHVLFTAGYGGWETYNLSDMDKELPVKWEIMSTGIEETVPLELYSPVKGPHLISAIGDYGGFTHWNPEHPEPSGSHTSPYYANTNGVTGSDLYPEVVVRVGTVSAHHPEGKPLAWSEDGEITWQEPASIPFEEARNGHIVVSADAKIWVWTPERGAVYYTGNQGTTWNQSLGIPENMRVVADRLNSSRFYAIDILNGMLYESRDGGMTFESQEILLLQQKKNSSRLRGDRRGGQDRIYATPGIEGELWVAAYDGLYHFTPDKGWTSKDKVHTLYAFGFGRPAEAEGYPAMYIVGVVNGTYDFFRSDDKAVTWIRINDDMHQYGSVLHITGDPKKYGRVYIGTHGRGILYGDPE